MAPANETSRPITGSFRTIRKSVRDRWVWLALGLVVLLGSLLFAAQAHAAFEVVATTEQSDAIADMVRTSGPAGGLVLILGYFIRTWQSDIKVEIKNLATDVRAAHDADGNLRLLVNTLEGTVRTLRAEYDSAVRRISRLERRSSGTHPRADDE